MNSWFRGFPLCAVFLVGMLGVGLSLASVASAQDDAPAATAAADAADAGDSADVAVVEEALAALAGFLGLLIGSFLNVVIYRLPKMMEQQWAAECEELSGQPQKGAETGAETGAEPVAEKLSLLSPRSRCSACGHVLGWYENIPVASYLFLRGKCSSCQAPYGLRYPAVELAAGLLFAFCAWRWGDTAATVMWCGFSAALLALAMIDWDTTLLPDDITLPLLWAGLIGAMVASAAVAALFAAWLPRGRIGALAILGIVLAVVAQAGDLGESMLKRTFGAKDASNIIPGHGGFMDRVDGLIAAAVFAALLAAFVDVRAPAKALLLW